MPGGVVKRISDELQKLLQFGDVRERFAQQGAIPTPMTSPQYTAFIKAEIAKWGPVVKSSGAKVD
jgi:tripartite-type tricarboxylate transporter receptor subunit TctC